MAQAQSVIHVIARQTRMRGIARLVTRIGRLAAAIAARERREQLFAINELIARVVRDGVQTRVHTNGIAWARFDAESTENAA